MAGCPCCAGGPRVPLGITRRGALGLLLGGASVAVAGCDPSTNGLSGLGASMVSPQEEAQLGREAFAQIKKTTPISHDPALQARLTRVGRRIVQASGTTIPVDQWEFVVFDTPEINAFALPGGHIGAYRGILKVAQNDDQLAAVLGHEVGHVNAHHAAQRIGTSELTNVGVAVVSAALQIGGVGGGDQIASLLGAGVEYGVILPFSRSQELQADHLGLLYMAKAGYNPDQAIVFWQNMTKASQGGSPPALLSTHPSDQERIQRLEADLPQAEAIYRQSAA